MSIEHMLDLTIKPLGNGAFELCQFGGRLDDDPDKIHLHAVQIALLAERAGLLTPDPTARMSARHTWCVRALAERLNEIRRFYLDEILDYCSSGIEFGLHLRALEDLADEMLGDVGAAPVTEQGNAALHDAGQSNENSRSISVTPEHPKRGRPATGNALTNSERQARHREKQAEPGQAQQLTLTP